MKKSSGISTLAVLLWGAIGYTLLFTAMLVPALVLDGFVVMKLWEWFVVPTFSSAPSLHLAVAIGLSMLAGFMVRIYNYDYKPDSESKKDLAGRLMHLYVGPFLALFMGWIVALWA